MATNSYVFNVQFLETTRKIRVKTLDELRPAINRHFRNCEFFDESYRIQALDDVSDEMIDIADANEIIDERFLQLIIDFYQQPVGNVELQQQQPMSNFEQQQQPMNNFEQQQQPMSNSEPNQHIQNVEPTVEPTCGMWPYPFVIKDCMVLNSVLGVLNNKQVPTRSDISKLLGGIVDECQRLNLP